MFRISALRIPAFGHPAFRILALCAATALLPACAGVVAGGTDSAFLSRVGESDASKASFAPTLSDPGGAGNQQAGSGLKGGEVDDNTDLEKYLAYQATYLASNVTRVDVSQRFILQVVDEGGKAVPNAAVSISGSGSAEPIFTARSTSNGRVLFFPKAYPRTAQTSGDFQVDVAKATMSHVPTVAPVTLRRDGSGTQNLILNGPRGAIAKRVDVGFVLDVTGSMGDELGQIQRTINDI